MELNFCVVFTIIICVLEFSLVSSNPEVTLPAGKVRGYYSQTQNGKQYSAFEGIPYAKPPVGKHRFKCGYVVHAGQGRTVRKFATLYCESQPMKSWQGTWEANTLYKCLQYNHYTKPGDDYVIGNEDCLYVNVYTPNLLNNTLKDVIVFIHGGAFMFNHGGFYGPKYILDNDVIFVTLNYRLGPLGFLSTEDNVVPGNNGLKDQLLALKWIKTNIIYFGGNSNSITIAGMSAGGASAQLHALSPLSHGLFHRGISQSGTSLNPWVLTENSLEKSKQLAAHLGCPTTTSKEIIECLRQRSAYQIVHAVKIFQPWLYNPFSPFGVVVDKWSNTPFLPEHPYVLLRNKKIQNLPWIFSHVESEGLYPGADFIANPKYLEDINNLWHDIIPHILDFNNTLSLQQRTAVLESIKNFYFKDQQVSKSTFSNLIRLLSDRLFDVDIERAARLHAAGVTSPVYYYCFSYRGQHSKSEHQSGTNENYGASHGDDTVYVLSSTVKTQSTENDRKMSKLLMDMWITFSNTNIPQMENVEWTPMSTITSENLLYLLITSPTNVMMQSVPFFGNREFWDSLPLQENKNLFVVKDEL